MNEYSRQIMEKLRALKPQFKDMNLKRVRVFGSVVRGDAGPESDIDLLVDFYETPGLLKFINIKHQLEDRLECHVDMALPDTLHPLIQDDVLREAQDV